jgi:quaternary ammonium compound-resistance protein SugE
MRGHVFGWVLVLVAGGLEVLWPILMKQSHSAAGWHRIGWLALMMATMCASFGLLALAVGKTFDLPIGTAYAVWTGMGAAGAAIVGILLFNEARDTARLICLALVIIGIVGLMLSRRPVTE